MFILCTIYATSFILSEARKRTKRNYKRLPKYRGFHLCFSNDKQNVHDIGVTMSVSKAYDHMVKHLEKVRACVRGCERVIIRKLSKSHSNIVKRISDSPYIFETEKYSHNENKVFENVCAYLCSICANFNLILINLSTALDDCVNESGDIVCPSGRISQLVSSANALDNKIKIIPDNCLRKEMLHKVSALLKNSDSKNINFIREIIVNDYKDVLDKDIVLKEFNSWADHIF
jgi:hypothetical protein